MLHSENRKGNFLQNLTKEERTNIHDWIRKSFNDKLSSRTDLGKITVSHKKDNRYFFFFIFGDWLFCYIKYF